MAAAIRLSQQHSCSFNHLVGAAKKRDRDREAQRLRGLHVDDQLNFRRLLNRHVGRFVAFENPPSLDAELMVHAGKTSSVAQQATGRGELTGSGTDSSGADGMVMVVLVCRVVVAI